MSALEARARRIAAQALEADPGHPEAALWRVLHDPRTYRGMGEAEAIAVSRELDRLHGEALAWRTPERRHP